MNLLSKAERETIINFYDEEQTASVYTCNKALMKKLDTFCSKSMLFKVIREDEWSRQYELPKRCVSIRFPMKINVDLREQKASRAKGLSEYKRKRQTEANVTS